MSKQEFTTVNKKLDGSTSECKATLENGEMSFEEQETPSPSAGTKLYQHVIKWHQGDSDVSNDDYYIIVNNNPNKLFDDFYVTAQTQGETVLVEDKDIIVPYLHYSDDNEESYAVSGGIVFERYYDEEQDEYGHTVYYYTISLSNVSGSIDIVYRDIDDRHAEGGFISDTVTAL